MRRLFAYRNSLFGGNAPYVLLARYSHSNAIATAELLPLPNNIDVAETTRFSPRRNRDISANAILTHRQTEDMSSFQNNFRMNNDSSSTVVTNQDRHLQSYDCFGTIRLNSAMQSNVPSPFSSGMDMVTHLNMPRGQLAQESKFMSQNLHNSHYTALRNKARADWSTYDKDATIQNRQHKRTYCSKAAEANKDAAPPVLTKKEQLKKAFKEYGSTIVIFHVGISLVSLGSCYFLVNNGIDVIGLLDQLGYAPAALKSSVAAGASSFVVAYAIHKIFAPVRISITLGAAPFIVRYMRSKGLLKPKTKN